MSSHARRLGARPLPAVVHPKPAAPRTAIVLPSGCLFSRARPNSMETVVRTHQGAIGGDQNRIFCCGGADDHDLPGVEVLPAGRDRQRVLMEKLSAFQPEIVEHHQQVKQAVRIATALPDVAHVLYRHNALKTPRNLFDAWRYNRRYAAMDGFVFVSEAERNLFAATYPRLAGRAFAVPNPIDIEPWLAPPEHREPVIAFAGRAMPEKGLDVICAALPAVLDRHPKWRAVLMLADWDHHHRWASPVLAPLARYGDRVTILRSIPVTTVQRQMRAAAIALTPSIWAEPFGLAAVEAHAAGAALISSGRGGLREASGPHALYVDDITPDSLTVAIEQLIFHPLQRVAMARAAQRYVAVEHTPEKRAADLLRVRRQILSHRVQKRLVRAAGIEPA